MGHVAFRALGPRVVVLGLYLLVPFGPGRFRFVTPHAWTVILLGNLHVRVVRMRLPGAMAAFAREALVLVLLQLVNLIRVTFLARLGARKHTFARLQFRQ